MQSGQVSVWIPIIVGVIGLLGVMAGQLINAWREDRRWRREQEREDIRWKRESCRELAKIQHENTIKWREDRMHAYAELLASIDHVYSDVLALRRRTRTSPPEVMDIYRQYSDHVHKISMRLIEKVVLISSGELRDYVEKFHRASILDLVPYPEFEKDGFATKQTVEGFANASAGIANYRAGMVDLIRKEIGAEDTPLATYRLLGLLDSRTEIA